MDASIKKLKNSLTVKNYSPITIKSYIYNILKMSSICRKSPEKLTIRDYKKFSEHLVNNTNLSWNSIHKYHSAASYFFREIINLKNFSKHVRYPKRIKKLPVILSYSEVRAIFNQVTNFKHNTMLKLLYSTGIRMSELRHITLDSIDLERRTIHIKGGKGKKDRYVPLSLTMIEQLIEYLDKYLPSIYLFEPLNLQKCYSSEGVRFILKHAITKLKLKKQICIHSFRHSYATHMLEQGGNILVLQRILGHVNLNSTLVYLHTQNVDISRAPNPLDNLDLPLMLN